MKHITDILQMIIDPSIDELNEKIDQNPSLLTPTEPPTDETELQLYNHFTDTRLITTTRSQLTQLLIDFTETTLRTYQNQTQPITK